MLSSKPTPGEVYGGKSLPHDAPAVDLENVFVEILHPIDRGVTPICRAPTSPRQCPGQPRTPSSRSSHGSSAHRSVKRILRALSSSLFPPEIENSVSAGRSLVWRICSFPSQSMSPDPSPFCRCKPSNRSGSASGRKDVEYTPGGVPSGGGFCRPRAHEPPVAVASKKTADNWRQNNCRQSSRHPSASRRANLRHSWQLAGRFTRFTAGATRYCLRSIF